MTKWHFDLANQELKSVPASQDPPGYLKSFSYDKHCTSVTKKDEQSTLVLKKKRAMEIGLAPGKSLFMTAFMMYMSGSGVQIFSIMITAMALLNPLKNLFGISAAFKAVDDGTMDLTQPKLAFIGTNMLGIVVAMYKCGTMGLLPTTSADWTWLLPMKVMQEISIKTV